MQSAKFIKRYRTRIGMTQEQMAERIKVSVTSVQNWENGKTGIRNDKLTVLAEVFNIPLSELITAATVEAENSKKNNWSDFLFEEKTELTEVIDNLHLNLTQQDLFGILYIYGARILNEDEVDEELSTTSDIGLTEEEIEKNILSEDLKLIPFEFINKVKSIQFMNHADRLLEVIRYIRTDFLLKVLKMNPETEFNVKNLPKELICEFIDTGFREYVSIHNPELKFDISMKKAKRVLFFLEQENEIMLTNGIDNTVMREDLPENIIQLLTKDSGFSWKERLEKGFSRGIGVATDGIWRLTDYDQDTGILTMNKKGRQLLKWFKE